MSTVTTSALRAECLGSASELSLDFCTGYILAIFDRMSATGAICPNSGAATEQAIAVGRRFIEAHPELWDRHPSFVLNLAFVGTFGCKAN